VRVRKDKTGKQHTTIQPSTAKTYANRSSKFPMKITTTDQAYRLFIKYGFKWGGAWRTLKDYQHFEKAGR